MSSFNCDKCGAICSDSARGYVTGCEHYPPDKPQSSLRGFGFVFDIKTGSTRRWVVGIDGVKKWADTMQPCDT